MSLSGKKIILGVTGSIAAYKTPHLVRLLVKAGASVQVVMTPSAAQFVSPLALATVSKNRVLINLAESDTWNNHVHTALQADLMLIAPCSAQTLARIAGGLCDTMVNAVYLSARCPVFIAPAMDEDMWKHPSTRDNVRRIRSFGNHLIPVADGELASGLNGPGRMAEPEDIVRILTGFTGEGMARPGTLTGRKVLVTAGPTYEKIDPVRFIGNFSSGKMGIALADELAGRGAAVTLVLGPTHLAATHPGVHTQRVVSAEEMYRVCTELFPGYDAAVLAAAVADYRPEQQAVTKIKKKEEGMQLDLVKNPDILAALGRMKTATQILAGFALETDNELEHARRKLHEKRADLIVLNSLREAGAGFGHDTNRITILDNRGGVGEYPLLTKQEAAVRIVDHMFNHEG